MTEPTPHSGPLSRKALLATLLIPAIAALAFVFYTHEVWEDFFITFRYTENLVKGNGLVYQPGEHVHGFTSVINTLLPALPLLVLGNLDGALLFYRLCSLGALLWGLYVLLRSLARSRGTAFWEVLLIAMLVGTSVKIIVFTMNGQESGFLVGFLCLALAFGLRLDEPKGWRNQGLAWAGLLYTRPDSPLYIVLLAGIAWSVYQGSWRSFLVSIGRSAGVAAVCFAPWVLWAWWYYGSPVPYTITAKAGNAVLINGDSLATVYAVWGHFIEIVGNIFGPIYGPAGWPGLLGWGAHVAGFAAGFFWVVPTKDRFTRSCSFALFVILVYLAWLRTQRNAYPWYFGPSSLLGILVMSRIAVSAWSSRVRWGKAAGISIAVLLAAMNAGFFYLTNVQLRIQQVEIEEGTRKAIGLWIRENADPSDTVFLEPMGYIGYYSGARILDYPGLVSPAVVEARRGKKAEYGTLPSILKPTWIVARNSELRSLLAEKGFEENYVVAKAFDSRPSLEKYGRFAGEPMVRFDAWFVVLHRKPGAP